MGRTKPTGPDGQPPGEPAIRPARSADLDALGRLGALLVDLHHGFDARRFLAPGPGTARGYARFFATQLGRPEVVLLVAERRGHVAGYAYATLEGDDYMALRGAAGVAHDLVVDPAERGQGLGRRLLEATVRELRARGAPRIVLTVAERNGPAQRMFAAAGFRRTMAEMTLDLAG